MKINIIDLTGKTKEELNIKPGKALEALDRSLLTQYIRVVQTNARQGTSKVKDKSEVSGGGKKPWKQKGTGRARAGSSRSPLWVGGGVTHGPTPKDWSIKALKNLKKKAMQLALTDKISSERAKVVDFGTELKYSTKTASQLLDTIKFEGKTLVVHSNSIEINKSFRNLANARVRSIDELSAYDLVGAENILMDKTSFEVLNSRFLQEDK